jgi:hypothetical protein
VFASVEGERERKVDEVKFTLQNLKDYGGTRNPDNA